MSPDALPLHIDAFAGLLMAAVVISILAERARIPGPVLLVAFGVAAHDVFHATPPFPFGPTLLFVFLPPLIFEAAWNVDLDALVRQARRIALLAFPGTLVIAFSIAGILASLDLLSFGTALLYGAIVAATDPVAVVALFRDFPVPADVRTIVEGESIANDGVAVVLYGIAITLATGGTVAPLAALLHAVVAILGGAAVGTVAAFIVFRLLRATEAPAYEVTATVALAYGAYLAADRLGFSGILATAATAVVMRALQRRDGGVLRSAKDADYFWTTGAYIVNAIVFISTGALIDAPRIANEPVLVATAVGAVLLTRAVLVFPVMRTVRGRITVFLAGMRGALPLALALSLPPSIPQRPQLIDAVFATVLATLVVQGFPLAPILARLYRRSGGPESSSYVARGGGGSGTAGDSS